MRERWNVLAAGLSAVLVAAVLAACTSSGDKVEDVDSPTSSATPSAEFGIASLSNPRPDMISGGEVLVRVSPGRGLSASAVKVTSDGADVTSAFTTQSDGTLVGLVTKLKEGANSIVATGGGRTATLAVTNHPDTGPVFSGPQQEPFVCQTTESGLAAPTDTACDAPTTVAYRVKTSSGKFQTVKDPTSVGSDDVATVDVNGKKVPFIVRIEQGVVNRAVYQFLILWDGGTPNPTSPSAGWNGRLVYSFGGGCNAGYTQGSLSGSGTGPANDIFLSEGYAVATSTLNVFENNCSSVISAETAMMVKERFIDTYGPVTHTIGWGGSGGGIQQVMIADSYPGILDGIIPGVPFPNGVGNTLDAIADCTLLNNYLGRTDAAGGPGGAFSVAQKTAIAGFNSYDTCGNWQRTFGKQLQATASCNPAIPAQYLYDAVSNPTGITCTPQAQNVNQLGKNPSTGFPNSVFDNVGVQYGLGALLDKQITPDQFAALNAAVGGLDAQGNTQAARTSADQAGLQAMYADNLIMNGGLGLKETPMIDLRTYLDGDDSGGDIHTSSWSFVIRQRMLDAGDASNSVILETKQASTDQTAFALSAMNSWLDRIAADTSGSSAQQKVAESKPSELTDGCFLSDSADVTREQLTYNGTGQCSKAFPVGKNPRLVAGQGWNMMQLKCQLTPLSRSAYQGITFSDSDWASLTATFPNGVCDWSKPGVGAVTPKGTWLSY